MRKVYNLFALALLFIASTIAVQAEKRYKVSCGSLDEGGAWTVDNIETGVPFVIQSGHMGDGGNDFIKGNSKSTTITDENLFVLEADGENSNGEAQYILQRYSSKEYVTSSYTFETSRARAWRFVILEPQTWTTDDIASFWTLGDEFQWRNATTVASSGYNDGVIFVDASAVSDTTKTTKSSVRFLCSGEEGKTASISNDLTSNRIELFTVVEKTGYEYVEEILGELFPDDTADLYNVGSDPGEISQELYDELVNSYNAALELVNNQSEDQTACEAAVERCEAAIEAAKNGAVKIAAGYYYFGGTRTTKDDNGNPTNAVYDDGEGMHWTYGTTWSRPDVLDMDNAKYVWYLEPQEGDDDAYYVQNFYTKRYANVATEKGAYIKTTDDLSEREAYLIYPYDKDYFVIQSVTLKANPIEGWNGTLLSCMHQPGDHDNLVMWTADAEASHWQFLSVPQSEIDALEGELAQAKLNDQLQELVDDAQASYDKGFTHSFTDGALDGAIDVEEDGVTPTGLVKTIDQLSFNATETQEGSVDALLDASLTAGMSDKTNFYHSIWSSSAQSETGFDNTTTYPYIQADLGKAVAEVSVKMWPRYDESNGFYTSNLPGNMLVSASNDGENWTEIGTVTTQIAWKYTMTDETTGETATSSSKVVGYATVDFGGDSYRYVRLEVMTRNGSTADFKTLSIGSACFNMGEIRFFESAYDASLSIIEAVDPTVRANFEAALETAKAELEEESATQATIDALQAAYDEFLANYPDPDIVKDMIADAKDLYENSEEGSEMGYYEEGARAEYLAAIEAVEASIKDVMTIDEVSQAKAAITAANEAFNARLRKPESGKLYYVKSLTSTTSETGGAQNAYLYASGNSAQVKWGKSEDLDLETCPQYVWRLESAGTGYILRNMLTNEAINSPKENNASVTTSTEADTCAVSFTSRGAGIFNLVTADGIYFNAQPTGTEGSTSGKLVTWNSASGNDNSAFTFVAVEESYGNGFEWPVTQGKWNIVTLPVDATVTNGAAYTVVGRNGDNIILSEIAGGNVQGGVPFVFKSEEDDVIFLDNDASDWEALAASAVTSAQTVNGLVGTLAAVDLHPDLGILYNGTTVICSISGDSAGNNSGYFNSEVPATTETGDAQIPAEGEFTAINTVVDNATVMTGNVYTLSGVKVRSNVKSLNDLNGLPAGIYILGNQKVIVK